MQGLQLLEFNASDTRNKAHIEGESPFMHACMQMSVAGVCFIRPP